MKPPFFISFVGLAVLLFLLGCVSTPPQPEAYHAHADFAVFIHGEKLNFAQQKYMTTDKNNLSKKVHLHDMDGNVIHFHADNATLGMFFESLDMNLTSDCFTTDMNESFCTDTTNTLTVWVNGKPISNPTPFIPHDLDRILISYGNESQEDLNMQMNQITDAACIQSEKCPERGKPSDESTCAGSGDCQVGEIPTA